MKNEEEQLQQQQKGVRGPTATNQVPTKHTNYAYTDQAHKISKSLRPKEVSGQ